MVKSEELAEIVAQCRAGRNEGFSRLVDIYAGRLYGYYYRLTGDTTTSDDLLGELFLRLVEKIHTFAGGSFESWLFRTASNIFHDYLRDKQRRSRLSGDIESEPEQPAKAGADMDSETVDNLQQQISKLDPDTRELILLRFYSQTSFRELAAMRGEPIGTTLSKVHRGLKRLRELMG